MANWSNCKTYDNCDDERKDIVTYCDVACSKKQREVTMYTEVELWERHNADNGEHIWCGDKHIADIVTDTDNPEWDKNVNEIAKAAILMHNDPKYQAAPDMYEALKALALKFETAALMAGLPPDTIKDELKWANESLSKAEGEKELCGECGVPATHIVNDCAYVCANHAEGANLEGFLVKPLGDE